MQGAVCPAFYPQPVAAPGYYPVSRDSFVGCVPPTACPGGNASFFNANVTSLAVFFSGSVSDVVRGFTISVNWILLSGRTLLCSLRMATTPLSWSQVGTP